MKKREARRLSRKIRKMGSKAVKRVGLFGLSADETEAVGIDYIVELYSAGYNDDQVKEIVVSKAKEL